MYARGEGHDHDSVRTRSVLPDHTWTEGPLRTINRAVCRWPLSLVVLLVLAAPVAPNVPITRLSDPNPWSPAGHMAVGRAFPTATLLPNGTVLVAGGAGTSGRPLASAELYEPRTGHWTMTGRMVSGCYSCTATPLADGRVLVTGGVDSSFAPLDSAELYDPHTGTWTATGRMAVARQAQTETLLRDGRVLVAGGATGALALDRPLPARSCTTRTPAAGRLPPPWRARAWAQWIPCYPAATFSS